MNIGGRILERLKFLGWERKDLLERVPNLTPQSLSNLIVRDSVRSEYDVAIAEALGVSVMWLVYGVADYSPAIIRPITIESPSKDELDLLNIYRGLDDISKGKLLERAQVIADESKPAKRRRRGT